MPQIPKALIEARARLMVKAVFFSTILYDQANLTFIPDGDEPVWRTIPCPTAMTDGYNIVINMSFLAGLNVDERVFVLAHEVFHVMAMHPKRMRRYMVEGLFGLPFVPQLFNIAADIVINKCLKDGRVGKCPKGAVEVDKIGDYTITGLETAEEIYKKLLDNNPALKKIAKDGSVSGRMGVVSDEGGNDPLGNDVIPISPDKDAASKVNEAGMKAAVKAAMETAKSQGTMPAGLKAFIDAFLESEVHWEDVLRSTVIGTAGSETSTWSRPNRRKIVSPGVYLPRRIGLRTGHVVIAIDTSGSVSDTELRQFLGEVASILGDCRPKSLILIYCDAAVDGVEEFEDPEELRLSAVTRGVTGRGGTSFIPPFEYVQDHQLECDVFIYLTDGYGPFPKPELAPFRTIWCISNDQVVAPFGETIPITTWQKVHP